jgi:hypothetical protein
MTVTDVYDRYHIMPVLRLHQLRVAAVAKQICASLTTPANTEAIVATCLIHDMGNILKFDLTYFPDATQPEGPEYWERVKADYAHRYGTDEHAATAQIAKELGVSDTIQTYLSTIGFSQVSQALHHGSLEQQICCYADQRVAPSGVVSIYERLEDGRQRYANRPHRTLGPQTYDTLARDLEALETAVFKHTTIRPEAITNATIEADVTALASAPYSSSQL